MKISFENQVALVTGAASGIGLATAKAFAQAGAAVALADVNEDGARAAADQIVAAGYKAIGIGCNVADLEQVEAMVKETVSAFGRLDLAFNNAGIQNALAETADATAEDFDRVNSVNLRGLWACMKYELTQMRQQGSGAIVNCSSLGGLVGGAQRGTYHAAKHGVLGLTKSAALEYATRGIRVNAVCPGLIWTPMVQQMVDSGQKEALDAMVEGIPMRRHGRPDEIADAVLWLCSSAASYVTGQSISVDGGFIMR
ncbi:Levodione reductase [Paraburkholderia kirstenboschensis]|uniref:SDR family NAD(P)-dependent oxidoreductase n=1 Tax=Paraburkholderia kirstenboschensis TaxID=1245436 RepID=UPI000A5C53DA|nr:glucose 1-dehydrogenase [Paraburkholderia kirstenboschensis]CAD6553689.1 Levodione reductase [Paraburkholderia kirstenboschensis]